MILICEGKSDKTLYSMVLNEIYSFKPETLGIEFIDIGGVGNAVGSKRTDRFMALKHLVDYQHHRLTIVFIALDDEGGAKGMLDQLCKQKSIWDSNRMVTCPEYTCLWEPQLEYANFSTSEMSSALNSLVEDQTIFSEFDVINASKDSGDTIRKLFAEKAGLSKNPKETLPLAFTNILIQSCKNGENPYKSERPIFRMLRRIIWMCSWHSLPNSIPEENSSREFWFGTNSKIRDRRYRDWINEPLIDRA